MRIKIVVKAGAKNKSVEKTGENEYRVSVKAPAKEGKANEAVVKILADYFKMPHSSVTLLSGLGSKTKWIKLG